MNERVRAKWIWKNGTSQKDEHVEFFAPFFCKNSVQKTVLYISADSDYGVFVNGKRVAFGQYPDYPHYKVYDKIDITEFLVEGNNALAIEAWYYGENSSTYTVGEAGVWFFIVCGEEILIESNQNTLSRLSKTYASHLEKKLTAQLGYSYAYDARKEDGWKTVGGADFTRSEEREDPLPSVLRPIKNLEIGAPVQGKIIKTETGRVLLDFGKETVGVFRIRFQAEEEQKVTLAYGEHITDGWVRSKIGDRDFSIEYFAKKGENDYTGYFRRLGLRYAEIRFEYSLRNLQVEILPVNYPVKEKPFACKDKEFDPIYKVCVDTLKLCMHDHYEDCPWREQALYIMDSRNQMLCGYYAFEEYAFARANLKLISQDNSQDGMLSICYPAGTDLTIPSFGLHFFTQVKEYGEYSGDWEFVKEIFPKLESVLRVYLDKQKKDGGLISKFEGARYWNFYEWADGLANTPWMAGQNSLTACEERDLVLNCLLSLALQNMAYICEKLGKENGFLQQAKCLNERIYKEFYRKDTGAFALCATGEEYTELGNALAVLCGVANEEQSRFICEKLTADSGWTKITLSMKCFKYDALLKTDTEKYRAYILEDIKSVYNKMLASGATSVWETEKGESDFDGAGSLCHGWSAMPVYYLQILQA